MPRFPLLLLATLLSPALTAQFSIPEPVVATGPYAITDTVYMSPDGDDSNPGTVDQPVKSFQKALQLLPFGTPGVNGGNAYGLIRLLPGTYVLASGFSQGANQWQNGNTYKNVSVEGIGEVQIGGTVDAFCAGHGLRLMGSHIFVKNITIKYAEIIGLLIHRDNAAQPKREHVLIDDVRVDSVKSFAMLLTDIDVVEVRNSRASWSARPGADAFTSPCQWPSGIKFHYSSNCRISGTIIEYSRGEGLNFHNVLNGEAFDNLIHDNGLNIYNDNSKNLIIRNNFVYNTPGSESTWRNCPADTHPILAPAGMMLANEGSCRDGWGATYQNCTTNCFITAELFPQVDSVFIYNNIFQNVGSAIMFWEGVTSQPGINCIRNVFVHHNTFITNLGDPAAANARGLVDFYFPAIHNTILNSGFAIAENIRITRNIFVQDPQGSPHLPPVRMVRHNLFPVPIDVVFDHNIWTESHAFMGANDVVRSELPADLPLLFDSLHLIQPCADQQDWVLSVPETGEEWLGEDYVYKSRNEGLTNAGALEYREDCQEVSSVVYLLGKSRSFHVFPNPANEGKVNITGDFQEPLEVRLFDTFGRICGFWRFEPRAGETVTVELPEGIQGLVFLELNAGQLREVVRVVIGVH